MLLLGVVLAAAVVVSLIFAHLRQSLILGYFLCGIVLGNSAMIERLGFSQAEHLLSVLADVGVLLLMFTLGIEFSIKELRKLRRMAFLGGGMQMAGTLLLASGCFVVFGAVAWSVAGLFGFILALSSTALALRLFQDSGQGTGPGARLALGVALFQDLAVIVMILLLPALFGSGGSGGAVGVALLGALLRSAVFLLAAWLAAQYAVPGLLRLVTATRSRELFTLTVTGLCAGLAAAGWAMGLSLPLGAFVAGVVVSESVYSHRILADVIPFKDLFLAIFFIAVGSLIDLGLFAEHWVFYVLVALLVFLAKTGIAFFAGRFLGCPVRASLQAAVALGSLGEFSLVLASRAVELGLLDRMEEQFLLITTALTMTMAPLAFRGSGRLGRWMEQWPVFRKHVRAQVGDVRSGVEAMDGHAIICGYGPVGRRLDEALRRCGVETLVVELNVATVEKLKKDGRAVLFADAAQAETLPLAGVERAALLAVTFPQLNAARGVVAQARSLRPELPVFCRAKFDQEVEVLRRIGVEHVVQDELECSVGLVRRAMQQLDRDAEEIDKAEQQIRFCSGSDEDCA